MSIMNYNGGTCIAMCGNDSVCIASDLRLGEQFTTIARNVKKVHKLTDRIYVGFGGFYSDATVVLERLQFRQAMFELNENRAIKPKIVAKMLSNLLYSHRFGPYFIDPIIAGLDPLTNKPEIYGMDLIGCLSKPRDFLAVGTAEQEMLGCCEAYWKPDMDSKELFEATSQALLAGLERNAGSGWGGMVYTITKDKVTISSIKTRMD